MSPHADMSGGNPSRAVNACHHLPYNMMQKWKHLEPSGCKESQISLNIAKKDHSMIWNAN